MSNYNGMHNGSFNERSKDNFDVQNILFDLFDAYSVSIGGGENHMDLSSWRHFYRQNEIPDDRIRADTLDMMFQSCVSRRNGRER
jgi:hypothetical protein